MLDRVRSGGLQIDSDVEAGLVLPAAVERAAYRIVQEALTNVTRHAGAITAKVLVRRTGDDKGARLVPKVGDARVASRFVRRRLQPGLAPTRTEDLGVIDLAVDDLSDAESRQHERHTPAVAVEHRQGVEVGVVVVDAHVEAHRERFNHRFLCVSCTPFGRAVVPDV